MKNDKKIKISIILNTIIVIWVLFSLISMFVGFKFMNGHEVVLESTSFSVFKYFTIQSNVFAGIVSLLFIIKEIDILKGKIKKIDKKYYILKFMSSVSVGLTFLVVFAYLGPITKCGIISLLMNSNLFLHLLIPLLCIVCFIFFEGTKEIKFKEVLYGLLPTIIYAVYYITNILIHMEGGRVSTKYDWYWFVQNGVWTAVIVVPIILLINYLISLFIWYFNKSLFKAQ